MRVQLIPVGAVQALVNVNLLNKIPPFHQLLDIQFTNAIIVSILPGEPCAPLAALLVLTLASLPAVVECRSWIRTSLLPPLHEPSGHLVVDLLGFRALTRLGTASISLHRAKGSTP